jgi:hypothetical protein
MSWMIKIIFFDPEESGKSTIKSEYVMTLGSRKCDDRMYAALGVAMMPLRDMA